MILNLLFVNSVKMTVKNLCEKRDQSYELKGHLCK